ncbi:MAG: response regulator [Proteobacteria bacterium]|nr:response regulator [Pseudomonadota bacterium]MBU1686967.1 response regulator [Pseudomonadota bacterium]
MNNQSDKAKRNERWRDLSLAVGLFLLLATGFITPASVTASAPPVIITPQQDNYILGPHLDILEDPSTTLTIDQVSQPEYSADFQPNRVSTPNFGFTQSAYWFRFSLNGDMSGSDHWFLELAYPLLDSIELYLPQENGFQVKKAGDHLPFSAREIRNRNFIFRLSSKLLDGRPIYIRVESESTMNLPLRILSEKAYTASDHNNQFSLGMYSGFLIVMIIYSFLMLISLRDLNYLIYLIFIICFGHFQIIMNGTAYEYLWPNQIWWNNYSLPASVGLATIGVGLFTKYFLNTKQSAPRCDKVIITFCLLSGLGALVSFAGYYALAIRLTSLLAILTISTNVICGIICLRKRYRPARYFMVAWSMFFLGVIINALRAFGVLPTNFITLSGPQIGSALTMIMLALALADRINIMKAEKVAMQEQYQAIFDNATEGIFRSSPEGRILMANQALASMLGFSTPMELMATYTDLTNHCYANPHQREELRIILARQETVTNFEVRLKRADGQVFDASMHARGVKDVTTGRLKYLEGILNDITQRKRAEDLLLAKERAEAENRSKTAFLTTMSHEIRTPLNGVIGLTGMLLNMDLSTQHRKFLKLIKTSSDRLLAIINDILDFAKIEAGKMDLESIPFSLRESLENPLQILKMKASDKGLEFSWHIDDSIPDQLIGDPVRLPQVIMNLLDNGIKFTREGLVTLKVTASEIAEDSVQLIFTVEDTGIGIPKDQQESIFKSFSQADSSHSRQFGGTGLGLAISKELAAKMGGQIRLESPTDQDTRGSVFHFELRLKRVASAPPERAMIAKAEGRPVPLKNLRILLVDDEPINRILARELLTQQGWKVTEAVNGPEALALLDHERFDLIIMDIEMPEMDGYETTTLIRAREKEGGGHLPIVALTAHAIQGYREKCLSAGMDDYLSKPFELDDLLRVISRLCST